MDSFDIIKYILMNMHTVCDWLCCFGLLTIVLLGSLHFIYYNDTQTFYDDITTYNRFPHYLPTWKAAD